MDEFTAALRVAPALLTTRTAEEEQQATAFLFDAAIRLIGTGAQQSSVLLVTPSMAKLDAAVVEDFATRGLYKLEIR